jgi:hypothetical protein
LSARMDGLEHMMRDLLTAHQGIRQQLLQLELRVAETDVRRELAELTAHMEQVQMEAMERINALYVNQGAEASAEPAPRARDMYNSYPSGGTLCTEPPPQVNDGPPH